MHKSVIYVTVRIMTAPRNCVTGQFHVLRHTEKHRSHRSDTHTVQHNCRVAQLLRLGDIMYHGILTGTTLHLCSLFGLIKKDKCAYVATAVFTDIAAKDI